jgi:hypothetical protein
MLGGIPQQKLLGKADNTRIALQEPEREGMERHDVETGCRGQLQQPGGTIAHLIGSLLGEGHGQNALGIYALANEMNEAPSRGAGLAKPGPARVSWTAAVPLAAIACAGSSGRKQAASVLL